MSQVDSFVETLKTMLKGRGITYRDLAPVLELSESSVKRLFSTKALDLARLELICQHFELSLAEILRRADFSNEQSESTLEYQQELALAQDLRLLNFYVLLHDGRRVASIIKDFQIERAECERHLLKLDKLGLIELHARSRIKMKGPRQLVFKRQGPLGKVLFEQAKENYLKDDFEHPMSFIRFVTQLRLTPTQLAKYKAKLQRLEREIEEEARFVPKDQSDALEIGVLLSFRPWRYEQFTHLKLRR